jgi:SAM-dependent methyltransferase
MTCESIRKTFNSDARDYKAKINQYHFHRRISLLKSRLNRIQKKSKILEVGVGPANSMREYVSLFNFVVGVDLSENMLQQAKKNLNNESGWCLTQGNAEQLPFQSDSFDVIISVELLQYLYDLELFFSDVERVLKRGGRIIIINWNGYYDFLQFLRLKLGLGTKSHGTRYPTPDDIIAHLRKHGFTDVDCTGVSIFPLTPRLLWGLMRAIDSSILLKILKRRSLIYLIEARLTER